MATTVDRRVVEIDVRLAREMAANVKRATESVTSFEKSLGSLKSMALDIGATLTAGLSVQAFVAGIRESLAAMDDMLNRAQAIGVTTEALSALTLQAQLTGVSAGDLDSMLVKLNKNLADLGTETNDATRALAKMGVVAGTDTEQALAQIADHFAKMPDGIQKTALATELFGRSGARLIPLLNEGAAGIAEFRKEAERLGIIVSEDMARAAAEATKALTLMQAGAKGMMLQLTQGLVPALVQVAEAFTGTTESAQTFRDLGEGLGEILKFIAKAAIGAGTAFITAGKAVGAYFASIGRLLSFDFKGAITVWTEFAADIEQLWMDSAARMGKIDAPFVAPPAKQKATQQALQQTAEEAKKAAEAWVKLIDAQIEGERALGEILTGGETGTQALERQRLAVEASNKAWVDYIDNLIEGERALAEITSQGPTITQQFMESGKAAADWGKLIRDSVEGWSRDAAEAVLDFATGAERDITKMVEGILRQFARLALQRQIFDPLFAGLTGGGGAAVPSAAGAAFGPGGRLALAQGGVVTGPTAFRFARGVGVMGEAGPEAVLPLARTSSGDLGVQTSGSGLTVNVINQAGVDVDVSSGRSADGAREVQVLIQRAVSDGFARGRFDSVMGATYGLARRGH